MTEQVAMRYLVSKGWQMIEKGWFVLAGLAAQPVCTEKAYHLQQLRERA